MGETLLALRILLALLLYGFLGVALYILWRDLRREDKPAIPRPAPALLRWQTAAGEEATLDLGPVTGLGRADDNSLPLEDPFASAHHALIVWREGQWHIEDLGSHNGTYLNSERVSSNRVLASGDEIQIGETRLRFELRSAAE
ncbi:MAG TPA: FHA domain-containing protein [Anaerolineae bacterium]|nr:FHA domain-containing protein [Anaerolineae bacterium]HXK41208.1 FHA domain-containing protein [Anaerolineae bacterium]